MFKNEEQEINKKNAAIVIKNIFVKTDAGDVLSQCLKKTKTILIKM